MSKSKNLEDTNTLLVLAKVYNRFKAAKEKSIAVTLKPYNAKNTEF